MKQTRLFKLLGFLGTAADMTAQKVADAIGAKLSRPPEGEQE